MENNRFAVLDLFSGAGGFTLGFAMEDIFDVKVSIDIDEKLSETYTKNFPTIKHICRDILSFNDTEIKELNKLYKFDVIIGGPPCQGFSLAGNVGRTQKKDSRNELFLGYLKFVNLIKPKVFIMENVAKLATHYGGKTLERIVSLFEEEGYLVQYKIINSKDYGIAQNRSRIFIIGTTLEGFKFPEPTYEYVTIREAINDLPPLNNGQESNIPNHNAMKHTEQMLHKMSYIKDGGNRYEIPEIYRPKSGDIRKYIRYNSKEPSICITGDMRKVFHYEQNRALTNRELARIQSFPDSFIFYGSSISIQQQIGNAVPPLLANKFAKKIKEFLLNE